MKKTHYASVHAGSKLTLPATMTLKSFNGEPRIIESGTWYVQGFWGDMCGLARTKDASNETCVQARELVAFDEVCVCAYHTSDEQCTELPS